MVDSNGNSTVALETLLQLLAEGGEGPHLDFKATCDLRDKKHQVELAKDIAAFSALGGHIIFGVDDDGTPSSLFTEDHASTLDESRVRAIALKYLPESVSVRLASHEHQGHKLVLMHIAPCPEFIAVFRQDGVYSFDKEGSPGRDKVVFRTGDVFVRDGTSSRRWTQHHVANFIRRVVAAKKDEWRQESRGDLLKLVRDAEGASLLDGPATNLAWTLDEQSFTSAATEAIRRADDIALKLCLESLVPASTDLISESFEATSASAPDFKTLVDRLSALVALTIRFDRKDLGLSAITTMKGLYEAVTAHASRTRENSLEHSRLWLLILTRFVLLGALSVRLRSWWSCAELSIQRVSDARYDEADWPLLLHASVMGHRNNILGADHEDGTTVTRLAHDASSELPDAVADLPRDSPRLGTSILQFDFLASMALASRGSKWTPLSRHATPGVVEPALVLLVQNQDVRAHVFPADDSALATSAREYEAKMKGAWFSPWTGWETAAVQELLRGRAE